LLHHEEPLVSDTFQDDSRCMPYHVMIMSCCGAAFLSFQWVTTLPLLFECSAGAFRFTKRLVHDIGMSVVHTSAKYGLNQKN
jgi:hypothetical protein